MLETICPMDMGTDHVDRFDAEMRLLKLGSVSVWPTTCSPMTFQGTPRLIRHSDPELYHLSLPLRGTMRISQAGREAVHGPWEMYIVDTSRPFDFVNAPTRLIGLEIPRRLLPLAEKHISPLVTRRLPGREGPGALLAMALTQLAGDAYSFRYSDGPRLETVLADLLAVTLAHQLDAEDRLPPETRSRTLALRIQAFVTHHLRDPDLTPRTVAVAHHISVSHVHRLFGTLGTGTTLAAWIRQQRLERFRCDLGDPAQRSVPIHHIAARWAFSDPAVFSRAFRAAYGAPPRDYRAQALGPPEP
ncbi:helix-turn-helix domain-containing protein [Streptomyces sp. 8K308]|uniref:AraC-like ligand-binding domain-containing protein n=1 Tax=Streptomyces sp. 8K308 TaxID=2530388 RepID=UPI001FB6DDED|nr:helix-turn-helix domain-containing protein [Streptomyces sp. 8K308]